MKKDLLDDKFGRFREFPLALSQKGHAVFGICLSYVPKNTERIKDGNVIWESINATRIKLPGLIQYFDVAQKAARKSDLIWACSDSIYGIIGYVLSKKYHIPLVFDLYDNFEYFLMARLPIIKHLYRHVVRNCEAVTCVSRPLERLVITYGRKKQTIILENAARKDLFIPMDKVKCRKILNLPKKIRLIGTAGALTSNRGIKTLYEAYGILEKKFHNLHLAVAGPRNVKIPQNSRIHDLGILPFEKIPVLLNALDVAVVCNKKNNFGKYCFPQKTMEIMACNIPIVAANVGSMKELFINKPEWLYEPDDKESLAKTLELRLFNKQTDYKTPSDWFELADILENTMASVL
jgi:glycosyltransferase involved in cell wall biosynthesis